MANSHALTKSESTGSYNWLTDLTLGSNIRGKMWYFTKPVPQTQYITDTQSL